MQNNDKDVGKPIDEVTFTVEKGSPANKVLQVLKHRQFDAEVTGIEVKGGGPGRHQLVKVDGVICNKRAGSSFTLWAIILQSGMAYLLSAQDPGETCIPLWPRGPRANKIFPLTLITSQNS